MIRRFLPFSITICTFFLCICLHESGHALAGLLTNGRVTRVALLTFLPHVRIEGVGTAFQESLRAAAGSGLYLATYIACALCSSRARGYWKDVRDAASWFAVVELLGWTLSALFGAAVTGPNDADEFIAVSGASRLTVAATAIGLGLAGAGILGLAARRAARRRLRKPHHLQATAMAASVGK